MTDYCVPYKDYEINVYGNKSTYVLDFCGQSSVEVALRELIRMNGAEKISITKNGVLDFDKGPAVYYDDGRSEYWVNGKKLTEEQFNQIA